MTWGDRGSRTLAYLLLFKLRVLARLPATANDGTRDAPRAPQVPTLVLRRPNRRHGRRALQVLRVGAGDLRSQHQRAEDDRDRFGDASVGADPDGSAVLRRLHRGKDHKKKCPCWVPNLSR